MVVGNRTTANVRSVLAVLVAALGLAALLATSVVAPASAKSKKAHDSHDRRGWDPPGRGGHGHGHGDHGHGHGHGHGWPGRRRPDEIAYVPSTPENTVLGGFPIDNAPVETVRSGQIVKIDTLTQSGATNATLDPIQYYGQFGVRPNEVLPDMVDFWRSIPTRPRYGGHILTGPVYVDGAQPGDTLEIEILDIRTRVPYGLNNTSPEGGVFARTYPGWRVGDIGLSIPDPHADAPAGIFPDVRQHLYRTGMYKGEEVAFFNDDIKVPLQKFMGILAVASPRDVFVGNTPTDPPPATGVQGSTPPGPYGGNMDVRDLTIGTKVYLPVFQPGARFYTGDPHSVQGNGEVSGTAIEQSLTGTFRFTLHKGRTIPGPFAEDRDNYITMGIDWDLDRAMKLSVREAVRFLVEEKGLTEAKAISLLSIAGDFQVGEVVDRTQVITGKIAKSLFGD